MAKLLVRHIWDTDTNLHFIEVITNTHKKQLYSDKNTFKVLKEIQMKAYSISIQVADSTVNHLNLESGKPRNQYRLLKH